MRFLVQQSSDFETSSVPFVKPSPIQSETSSVSPDQTSQSEANKNNQSEGIQELSDQSESSVVSRLHLSNQQRKVKEGFEQKQRDEAKKQALLEKKRHREVTEKSEKNECRKINCCNDPKIQTM